MNLNSLKTETYGSTVAKRDRVETAAQALDIRNIGAPFISLHNLGHQASRDAVGGLVSNKILGGGNRQR